MTIKQWAVAISLFLLLFLAFDFQDYATEIHKAWIFSDVPEVELKEIYPYRPFSGVFDPQGRYFPLWEIEYIREIYSRNMK